MLAIRKIHSAFRSQCFLKLPPLAPSYCLGSFELYSLSSSTEIKLSRINLPLQNYVSPGCVFGIVIKASVIV